MAQKAEPISASETYSRATLEQNRRMGFVTASGVVYEEGLANSLGMRFVLLREDSTTQEMLDLAVRQLRADRDVVGKIQVADIFG